MYQMFGTSQAEVHIVREQGFPLAVRLPATTQLFEPGCATFACGQPQRVQKRCGANRFCIQHSVGGSASLSLKLVHCLRHHCHLAVRAVGRGAGSGRESRRWADDRATTQPDKGPQEAWDC